VVLPAAFAALLVFEPVSVFVFDSTALFFFESFVALFFVDVVLALVLLLPFESFVDFPLDGVLAVVPAVDLAVDLDVALTPVLFVV